MLADYLNRFNFASYYFEIFLAYCRAYGAGAICQYMLHSFVKFSYTHTLWLVLKHNLEYVVVKYTQDVKCRLG